MPRDGFKDLEKQLNQLAKKIEKQTTEEVAVSTLLDAGFMSSNTKFGSFNEFLAALPDGSFEEMLENDKGMVDNFVAENTNFQTWDKMLESAGEKYMAKKLKKLF